MMSAPMKNIFTYSTANAGGASIDVTNIPQDGKHLLCYMTSDASNGTPVVRYNNLTTNYMYNFRNIDGSVNSSSTSASELSSISQWAWSVADRHGTFFIVPFYSSTNSRKLFLSHNGMYYYWSFNGNTYYYAYAGGYTNSSSNSAISSLSFTNCPSNISISIDVVY